MQKEKWLQYQVHIGVFAILLIYMISLHFSKVHVMQEQMIDDKKVAITFDDGPNPEYTQKLLDGLKERNVVATFFLIGKEAKEYPEIVARIKEDGHVIGNHTYDHVNLCCLDRTEVEKQIYETNAVLEEITGERPIYIRAPFGSWNEELSAETGMIHVMWNVDPKDWATDDTGAVITRVLQNVKDHDIILFHDASQSSVDAALAVVDYLKEKGYAFVGVEELLLD